MSGAQPDHRDRYANALVGKKVCITGGAGFIGSHIASELLDLGADIAVIDDLSSSDGNHLWYLVETYPERVKFCFASILENAALRQAVDGCEIVIHLAAMNSVPRSIEDPERCFAVNTLGTVRVCAQALHAGARRLVLASSSSVYGDDPTLPKIESMQTNPISPYAASKLAAEAVVGAWQHSYALPSVILRYFNVFGARQPADSPYAGVVPAFLHNLIQGKPPVIYGDGSQTRDFTHVSNVVSATLLAALADTSAITCPINIGCGKRTSVSDLAHHAAAALDTPELKPLYKPARAGDVPHSVADISRAQELLGYQPVKTLEQGLRETAAWMHRGAAAKSDPMDRLAETANNSEPAHQDASDGVNTPLSFPTPTPQTPTA